jgi:hypothetical protein
MTRPTEISTYNPHLVARDDLVASFIARQPLLDELVDDLHRGAHQHHLLVGARGAGKTTLLLRLAVAIEKDKKLTRAALPLRFPEEQYNVARPSDFWLNCLDALTDALEAGGDHAAKRKLEETVASITPLAEPERGERALAALVGWARSARRSLVLLVDNFDLILDRLRDAQWALREALSHDNGLVLIGGTSRFLEEAMSYDAPLYDFFRVHELGQLSEEEARQLVAHLAKLRGHARVQEVLEKDPGRFKALYVLTGGMPRMLVLLSSVLESDSASAEADLERMLDQLTPYYKARFDELSAQSQVIVNAVALHWHPITAAGCADQTRLDIKLVSAQLHRLVQQGLLTKTALPGSAKLGFLLTERFFNIWYLMRASRRLRQKLAWFVEFLRVWYGEEELANRAQALLEDKPDASDPRRMLALATALPDTALRHRLESRAVGMLLERSRLEEIRELLDLEGADAHLMPVIDRAKVLKQLRSQVASKPKLVGVSEALLGSPALPLSEKILFINYLLKNGLNNRIRPLVRLVDKHREMFGSSLITAISRGELPGFYEVATRADIVALLELAKNPEAAIVRLHDVCIHSPIGDEIFGYVLDCGPDYIIPAFIAITHQLKNNNWPLALRWARIVLRHGAAGWGTDEWLIGAADFFRNCVQQGKALDAAKMLLDLDLSDRLLPLYEALSAAANHNSDLNHLAPEVRTPTAELLALLQRPEAKTAAAQNSHLAGIAERVSGGRGATRRRTSRRRGRAASGGCRRARARRR